MPSLLNGISAMGAGVAQYAGTAGLEAQKAMYQQQSLTLADQLAHASRTAEIAQTGDIAATAATQAQAADMARAKLTADTSVQTTGMTTASAEKIAQLGAQSRSQDVLNEIAAHSKDTLAEIAARSGDIDKQLAQQKPLIDQQVAEATVRIGMAQNEQKLAQRSYDISTQIADETAKPIGQQDQTKLSALYNQRMQLGMTPEIQAKMMGALDTEMRTTAQEMGVANTDLQRLQAEASDPTKQLDPEAVAARKAEIQAVQAQRDSAYMRLIILQRSTDTYRNAPGAQTPAAAGGGQKPLSAFDPPDKSAKTPAAAAAATPAATAATDATPAGKPAPQRQTTAPPGTAATVGPNGELIYPPTFLTRPGPPLPPDQWPRQ